MRTRDIDTTNPIWAYTPSTHKMEHHRRKRRILLGPRAQSILQTWLKPDEPSRFLFSPLDADQTRKTEMRANRKTKVQPSQHNRSKPSPKKKPGERYTTDSYRRAITYGIQRANQAIQSPQLNQTSQSEPLASPIPFWHPHQLRHNAAERLEKEFNLETARAVLGHSSAAVTVRYAKNAADIVLASEAMTKIG